MRRRALLGTAIGLVIGMVAAFGPNAVAGITATLCSRIKRSAMPIGSASSFTLRQQ